MVHKLLMFFYSFFERLVAKVCLLVGKIKEVKGHYLVAILLLPGPLQKSHQCCCQNASRALLTVNPSVTSSAANVCDSFNLCLSFLLLLLLHTSTFPFMQYSYQS